MVDGDWNLMLAGHGKIHPADADEIQQLLVDWIATLKLAGHTNITGEMNKRLKD